MNSRTDYSTEILEIQRLTALLPDEVRSQVAILQSKETDPDLVATQRMHHQDYLIQIDFNCWRSLNINQRNLLFWHEVARIQGQGIRQSSREIVVMSIGGIALLAELLAQNLLGVATTLAVTGLAGYQLYQQYQGEGALRAVSAADQNAIKLAIQFGYSFPDAYDSLYSALQTLAKQKSQKSHWKRYQVRLRVLEMLSTKEASILEPVATSSQSSLQYQVSSLCS
jgi:hypothetical protein